MKAKIITVKLAKKQPSIYGMYKVLIGKVFNVLQYSDGFSAVVLDTTKEAVCRNSVTYWDKDEIKIIKEINEKQEEVKKVQRKCWNCKCWLQEKMELCNNPESPFYECNRTQYDWCGKIKY